MGSANVSAYIPSTQEGNVESEGLIASSAAPAPKTQIIAIYGKGGIGKSFTLANLSYMMAQQGK
ncbi:MAG: chlorophyllide reductase iron protein subunit X, partial [Alphaproteobacteria bacterium]